MAALLKAGRRVFTRSRLPRFRHSEDPIGILIGLAHVSTRRRASSLLRIKLHTAAANRDFPLFAQAMGID